MPKLLVLALLLMPLYGHADSIFRTTDSEGNVVFTDTPPPDGSNSEQVDIRTTNTTPAPQEVYGTEDQETPVEAEPEIPSYSVSISSPPNETTIAVGPGNFTVSSTVRPSLKSDDSLQLYMDGAAWGEPQRATSWNLTNVFRGQHDLTVGVIDQSGETLSVSQPVRVYVLRPSIITRTRNQAR
jgi:hypothetical protein